MAKRGYGLAFFIVFVAACAAAFFGGRYLLRTFQSGALSGGAWVPPDQRTATPAAVAAVAEPPTAQAPAVRPDDFTPDLSRVTVVPFASPDPTATATLAVAPVRTRSVVPAETPTPAASPTPTPPSTEYVATGPVRYSTGDCPGNYILGRVTGPNGSPLSDVRLLLVDEYGNAQAKLTKAGANEAGQYDFPLFGAHRRFYLSIAGADGNPLSPVVEIDFGLGVDPQASCHRLDWRKQ